MHLTQTTSVSAQRMFQLRYLRSQTEVFAPHVLRFGPLLQNVILANSVTKAMQSIGATSPVQQLTLLLESEKQSLEKISSEHATEMLLKQESNVCDMEKYKYCIPQNINATESYISEQQFGNCAEIQHQKQTSAQLMHFLRSNRNIEQFSFSGSEEETLVLKEQIKSKTVTNMNQPFIQFHSTHEKEMNQSVPVFRVKSSSAGFLTYSCMIATNSELWDIGDISAEMQNFPSAEHSESCVLKSRTQSFCASSKESMESKQIKHQCGIEGMMKRTMDEQVAATRIPEFQSKKFEEMPVVVSHVVSPGNFYIQHKDNNLQELSDVMGKTNSRPYAETNSIPDIGAYVMGWNAEQELWCRAKVTKICGIKRGSHHLHSRHEDIKNIEVEIRRVDYGDLICLSLWKIRELCEEVAKVPAQALQVSLTDVKPVNGESWSTEAVSWFKDKVNKRTLYARIYSEERRVSVELFMEKGKIGVIRRSSCLSLRLAQNGHARHGRKSCVYLNRDLSLKRSRKQSVEWEKYLISCYTQDRNELFWQHEDNS